MTFAPGIPDKDKYGDFSSFTPGKMLTLVVQQHEADRAGKHYDLRIGDESGLISWAIPSSKLPAPGEKVLAILQPLHTYEYKDFEGRIESGYGKGKVSKIRENKVLVSDFQDDHKTISLTIADEKHPSRFVLIKPKSKDYSDKDWLMINITPVIPPGVSKKSLKSLSEDELFDLLTNDEKYYFQPKLDGALGVINLNDKSLEIFSHRISRTTGNPIYYTEKIFFRKPKIKLPAKYAGSTLLGEVVGVIKHDNTEIVIPPQELSGILNSTISNAINSSLSKNIKLKVGLFDIVSFGGQYIDPSSVNYKTRRKLLQEIIEHLPSDIFFLIPDYEDKLEAAALWRDIKEGKNNLTSEGIVVYGELGYPRKVKTYKEADVYIRKIVPGEGKYSSGYAGAFFYSREPNGPIVGSVGTGFTDSFRKFLWENREDLIGRVARVSYLDEFKDGTLKHPSFIALHEDYPTKESKIAGFLSLPEESAIWISLVDDLKHLKKAYANSESVGEILNSWFNSDHCSNYLKNYVISPSTFKRNIALLLVKDATLSPQVEIFNDQFIRKVASLLETVSMTSIVDKDVLKECVKEATASFDVDKWGRAVFSSEGLSPWEKSVLITVPLTSSIIRNNDIVRVSDVVSTAAKMQLGEWIGKFIGNLASKIVPLPESVMENIVNSGKFVGLTKGVLGSLRNSLMEDPYDEIRKTLQV